MLNGDNKIKNVLAEYGSGKFADLQKESEDSIKDTQTELLKDHLEYIASSSPFYKELFKVYEIDHRIIRDVSDIRALPVTTTFDLTSQNYNFIASPSSEIAEISLSSTTFGKTPAIIYQTHSDLARLAHNEKQAFKMAGIKPSDTILLCVTLDKCFMAGLAYSLGGLSLNAKIVRGGAASAAQLWNLIELTNPSVLIGVPSIILGIAQYALEAGKNPASSDVKKILAVGEPIRDFSMKPLPIAEHLEELWEAGVFSTFATTEIATSFCECEFRQGGHLRPELAVVEILDEDDEPMEDGKPGEVVVTPLGVAGTPLLRFKTGDISFIIKDKCMCGRNTPRLGPILGRKKQMLKYKGKTIFPNTILSALEGKDFFYGGYVEAHRNHDYTDNVTLYAALSDESVSIDKLKSELQAKLDMVPNIVVVSREEVDKRLYNAEDKRKRTTFFDLR